jgi:hypothetical protein
MQKIQWPVLSIHYLFIKCSPNNIYSYKNLFAFFNMYISQGYYF